MLNVIKSQEMGLWLCTSTILEYYKYLLAQVFTKFKNSHYIKISLYFPSSQLSHFQLCR